MFKLLKNNLLRLLDETQAERSRLKTHPLYNSIKTENNFIFSWKIMFLQYGALCLF